MKHLIKIILPVIIIGIFNKKMFGQIIPPKEDQDSLENIFVSQCGIIDIKDSTAVYLFRSIEGSKHKIYLVKNKKGFFKLETVSIPPELIDDFWLINSGPEFFSIETSKGVRWYYNFKYPKRGLTKQASKKIVGHDNEGPIND